MNNLHRELAPISDEAWTQIEEEAARTFKRHLAGRRLVDVAGPSGLDYSAVGRGRVRAIFEGYAAAGIDGIRKASSNPPVALPADVTEYPTAFAQAVSQLRQAGVDGPYSAALSADAYTAVSETSDHGYPVIEHIKRLLTGEIIWAPAIGGAFVLTTRGGDFSLHLGEDLAIGYLSHTDTEVRLYLEETLTFLVLTTEAAVGCTPAARRSRR